MHKITNQPGPFTTLLVGILVYLLAGFPCLVFAMPVDGHITAGAGSIHRPDPNHMVIDQATGRMITNWKGFSIGPSEAVRFNQPGTGSVALNRVVGSDPSVILGQLSANGQVFLSNGSGVIFGKGSRVNTGGLIATTLNISDHDFLSGNYRFTQDPNRPLASILNQGMIHAADHGFVGLLAPSVENSGTIIANLGSVALASGRAATLDFTGDGLINFALTDPVDSASLGDRVTNSGLIQADGGLVRLSARAAGDIIRSVVNNTGVIEARSVAKRGGRIFLEGGDHGVVRSSGTLDASGHDPGETGGAVHVLGEKVGLFENARIDVSGDAGGGEALIGGDFQGKNPAVPSAFRTYAGPEASIDASALRIGDGGKVIVWADDVTRFYGAISARGGQVSGNGGGVEVSGKRKLNFKGGVDVAASKGLAGTLLLDPATITISTGADTNTTGFTAGSDNTEAFADDSGLGSVFDVTATTGSFAGVTSGSTIVLQAESTITVSSAFDVAAATGASNVSLTLQAGGNININSAITLGGSGALTISANDDTGSTQTGNGSITVGAALTTATGAISLTNNDSSTAISLGAGITSGGGNVTFSNPVSIASGVSPTVSTGTGGGNITFSSTVDATTAGAEGLTLNAGTGSVNLSGAVGGSKALGNISLTADTVVLGANITGTGTLTLQPSTSTQTVGIGDNTDGSFNLSATEVGYIQDGFSSITIGKALGTGAVDVQSVTFSDPLTIYGGTLTVASGATLSSGNNAMTLKIGDLDLQGTVNSGTADMVIDFNSLSDGDVSDSDIRIGAGSCSGCILIDNTELSHIYANNLQIGGAPEVEDITVDSVALSDTANITGTVTLIARDDDDESDVWFTGGASTFKALTVRASKKISVGVDLTTQGALTLFSGEPDADGESESSLASLGDSYTDGEGDDGVFSVASGVSINTNNHDLTINATYQWSDSFDLPGTIDSGTGTVTITANDGSTGENIRFGGDYATGSVHISNAELSRITAANLVIGGSSSAGVITVNGITAADSANISGTTTLKGSSVTFSGTDSTFTNALAVSTTGTALASGVNVASTTLSVTAGTDSLTSHWTTTIVPTTTTTTPTTPTTTTTTTTPTTPTTTTTTPPAPAPTPPPAPAPAPVPPPVQQQVDRGTQGTFLTNFFEPAGGC